MQKNKFRLYFITKRYSEYREFVETMAKKCAENNVPFNRHEVIWVYNKLLLRGRQIKSRREIGFGPSWREVCDLDYVNARIMGMEKFDKEPTL